MINSGIDDITDPSDWEKTNFPNLNELDSMLRCQICKDLLNSPVLTTCSHIFCSLCARRSISENNKCPLCLEETYESGLRKVLLLDGIVKWFNQNRQDLITQLTNTDVDVTGEITNSQSENEEQSHNPKKDAQNGTQCPICSAFMPLQELQTIHIDQCLIKSSESSKSKKRKSGVTDFFNKADSKKTKNNNGPQFQPLEITRRQRLPNLDTSLSTNKLKEKLVSLRLNANGTRRQLEVRLKEYITLYNANLDSLNPVNDRVLISRLNKWESLMSRSQNVKSEPITADVDSHNNVEAGQLEREEWQKNHNSEYSNLIAHARANKRKQQNLKNHKTSHKDDDFSDDDVQLTISR